MFCFIFFLGHNTLGTELMARLCISIFVNSSSPEISLQNRNKSNAGIFKLNQIAHRKFLRVGNIPPLHEEEEHLCQNVQSVPWWKERTNVNVADVNWSLQRNYHNCLNYEGVYHYVCIFSQVSPNNINSNISNIWHSFDVLEQNYVQVLCSYLQQQRAIWDDDTNAEFVAYVPAGHHIHLLHAGIWDRHVHEPGRLKQTIRCQHQFSTKQHDVRWGIC